MADVGAAPTRADDTSAEQIAGVTTPLTPSASTPVISTAGMGVTDVDDDDDLFVPV